VFGAETKLNLGYIYVALFIEYMLENGFSLQARSQLGFLVSAKAKVGDTKIDIKDNLKAADFGLVASMRYANPKSGFGIDTTYNIGLSNINENSSLKSYNRGLQVRGTFLSINNVS
jgi:Outer membrane protein beta-barrel domain